MNVLLPLLMLAPLTQDVTPTVARPAPAAGFRAWLNGSAPKRWRVNEFLGEVLIIHSFAWNCSSCLKVGVPLAVDLQRVASDAGLNVISVTTPAEIDETKRVVAKYGLSNPVALENPFTNENPYVDVSVYPITYFFVIGRNGELVWHGNPSTKLDECLEAIGRALDAPTNLRLERELHPELESAIEGWFQRDYRNTHKLAAKLVKKHGKRSGGDSARIAADAAWLIERIERLAQELERTLEHAVSARDATTVVRTLELIEQGFAKHALAERADELLESIEEDEVFEAELEVARAWRELQRERPVLVETRRERGEKRWVKALGRFVAKYDDSPWHAEARATLAAWKQTP